MSDHRIVIEFPLLLHDRAIVKNVGGRGLTRSLRDAGRRLNDRLHTADPEGLAGQGAPGRRAPARYVVRPGRPSKC